MKKTLLALAVATAMMATSANAVVVYQNEGLKVDVDGSVRLELQRETDKRGDLVDRGSRVRFRAFQDIGGGVTALGNIEIRFSSHGNIGDQVRTARLFAGFEQKEIGRLTFGKQLTNGDAVGVSDFSYHYNPTGVIKDAGNKVISFLSRDFSGFKFGLDYVFGNASKNNQAHANDAYVVALFYDKKFDDDWRLNAEAGYSEERYTNKIPDSSTHYKQKAFRGGLALYYKKFAIASDYYLRKASKNLNGINEWRGNVKALNASGELQDVLVNEAQEISLAAKYQLTDPSKVYVAYVWGKGTFADDNTSPLKMNRFIAGTDYKVHKNLVTYLEGQHLIVKQDGQEVRKDNQVHLGLRVFF